MPSFDGWPRGDLEASRAGFSHPAPDRWDEDWGNYLA